MSAISIVEYIHDLKEAGFTDKQSEVRSDLRQDLKKDWHFEELASKHDLDLTKKELEYGIERVRTDLELSIEKMQYETLKFVVWTGIGVVMATAGVLAKGFHWF